MNQKLCPLLHDKGSLAEQLLAVSICICWKLRGVANNLQATWIQTSSW